jgi:hypothetical protein
MSRRCHHEAHLSCKYLMTGAYLYQALAAFPTAFGGPPEVIVLGINLWDLARWKVCEPQQQQRHHRWLCMCKPSRRSACGGVVAVAAPSRLAP